MQDPTTFGWIVILGGIACFVMAFGIGANDVANNFGSSVGSKAIRLWVAVILAFVFEFLGAFMFGASVTDSVRKGVINFDEFKDSPAVLMYANLTALITAAIWLIVASVKGLPVSTTQSVVGSLIGVGLATGPKNVNWTYVGTVIASWFTSPLLAAIAGGSIFAATRKGILRQKDPVKIGYRVLWFLVFALLFVFTMFFIIKNPVSFPNACEQTTDNGTEVLAPCILSKWVSAHYGLAFAYGLAIAAGLTLLLAPAAYWYARRLIREYDARVDIESSTVSNAEKFTITDEALHAPDKPEMSSSDIVLMSDFSEAPVACQQKVRLKWYKMPWFTDVHAAVDDDEDINKMWSAAEQFDPRTECFFSFLQILSAIVSCLVHGANDVANATAPFSTIYGVYKSGAFEEKVATPSWILMMGGLGIGLGLAFLGVNVLVAVGVKLAKITPARGFSIETGMATVMVIGSFMGIPLSTTHCQVGSTVAVGALDFHSDNPNLKRNCNGLVNWQAVNVKLLLQIMLSWLSTLILTATTAAAVFSFGFYSPSAA
ncbi:MAG: uncharacterized protein KVP18_000288 [Porospora cf. gigantea A]|uniref:uncharacterized protein n=1 Tax=Porospora cf. gigantea A TaxID=2853593 RepID=UPI00355A6F8A|nr:MAG: hypothetical protein KVP18_000288 [Porospora cf. gigantea A]